MDFNEKDIRTQSLMSRSFAGRKLRKENSPGCSWSEMVIWRMTTFAWQENLQ
jgi:hypothetical protein